MPRRSRCAYRWSHGRNQTFRSQRDSLCCNNSDWRILVCFDDSHGLKYTSGLELRVQLCIERNVCCALRLHTGDIPYKSESHPLLEPIRLLT